MTPTSFIDINKQLKVLSIPAIGLGGQMYLLIVP
jgi:hypothetical protein